MLNKYVLEKDFGEIYGLMNILKDKINEYKVDKIYLGKCLFCFVFGG